MGLLSQNAVPTYLEMIRVTYAADQELMGDTALAGGTPLKAVRYYRNVLDADGSMAALAARRIPWDLSFPFAAPILEKIRTNADPDGKGRAIVQGLTHGKLAIALEQSKQDQEAKAEYQKASGLLGTTDVEIIKKRSQAILKAAVDARAPQNQR
jgi:hypothetical protein